MLELGIIVHSIIIGISMGASESPKTIRPLVAALTFHQFFEGMGLGSCIIQVLYVIYHCPILVSSRASDIFDSWNFLIDLQWSMNQLENKYEESKWLWNY